MRIKFTIAKNALANVVKGGASAVVALVLPHFLTKSLDHDRFAAWSLMLQIAAYANYLDFGLQTAVARFVAYCTERGEQRRRDEIVSTALTFLSVAAISALAALAGIAWKLTGIFQGIPLPLVSELRSAILVLGASAAVLLPFSAFSGVLVGLHRNEYVALTFGGSRILGVIAILWTVRHTQSLIALATCVAVTNLIGGIAQFSAAKLLLPTLRLSFGLIGRRTAAELGRYSAGLAVWSFSMFLVAGLDVTIVGHFDFPAVGYYSVAAALVNFFAGANSAVCNALMTPVAALHASGQIDRIRRLIVNATRLNTFFNLLATVFILLSGSFLLRMWVGPSYARPALPLVEILMVANVLRLVANPYASMLIATDQQKHGIAQGAIEGLTNFVCSILGAMWFGPMGVALGTLVGSVCGLAWTSGLTLKWVTEVPLERWKFIKEGMFRPLMCTLPLLIFTASMHNRPFTFYSALILMLCALGAFFLTDQFGKILPNSAKTRPQLIQTQ